MEYLWKEEEKGLCGAIASDGGNQEMVWTGKKLKQGAKIRKRQVPFDQNGTGRR